MNTNTRGDAEPLLAALWKIANGTALSAYPGSNQPKTLSKPEIHYIATEAYANFHTIGGKK